MSTKYQILRNRAEKTVKYKTPQGKEVCLTREVYLRDDVPCKSLLCSIPSCTSETPLLAADVNTFVVIDGFEALSYWEVFEFEDIKGLVITLSTINYVQLQARNKRCYRRIRASLDDPVQSCILFDNEFHQKCFRPPSFNEAPMDFTTRMNWIAANWYQAHLGPKASVILVTSNKQIVSQCASVTAPLQQNVQGLTIMDLAEFLHVFHPSLIAAKLLLNSLQASLQSKEQTAKPTSLTDTIEPRTTEVLDACTFPVPEQDKVYPEHLPESALLAGLRSGQFLRGILRVSRFRASTEAMVALTDASVVKHQPELKEALTIRSEIAIRGMQHRNRAIDGDVVVIRLLPRDQWSTVSSNVSDAEINTAEFVDTNVNPPEHKCEDERVDFIPAVSGAIPCGFVVGVINRNWRDYVCTYIPAPEASGPSVQEIGWVLVTPWDYRIPRIRIHTTQGSKLSKERFVVRIDDWEAGSAYPLGHFVQSLGRVGDLETETQTLLIEHNVAIRAFSDAQLNEIAPYAAQRPWRVDPMEVKRRRDLRSPAVSGNPNSEDVLIFSIDPEGCQDVDDALSAQWMEPILGADGKKHRRLQLGVHIADVTFFVPPGGFVDAEARRRSTSVYLADRRYDMLPGLLSGDLCSLWSGVDRYAVSVIWEIDIDSFDVLNVWYGRTVIRSSYKMTYEAAQHVYDVSSQLKAECGNLSAEHLLDRLGGTAQLETLVPELKGLSKHEQLSKLANLEATIRLLTDIASTIRARRMVQGGLELSGIELYVKFSDPKTRTGKLEDLVPKEPLEMHSTIAELMIFANHWVARRCLESYPDKSCLRRHPPPKPEFFEELRQCAASRGFNVEIESNRALSESLIKASDPKDPEVNRVLLQLATRAMTNALYFSTGADNLTRDQFAHYGLALSLYTHFTSPIRRYADMIVHRVLLTALGDCRSAISGRPTKSSEPTHSKDSVLFTEQHLFTPEDLSALCRHMNEQHWAAQQVQRASMELFQALFFRDRPEDDPLRRADGIICQLRGNNGFVVLISRYGIRGAVCVKDSKGQVAWAEATKDNLSGQISWMPEGSGFEVSRVHSLASKGCGHLEVRNSRTNECQCYRTFDHVLVSIHSAESTAHGLGLRLRLLSGPLSGPLTQDSNNLSSDDRKEALIQTVQSTDAERRRKRALEDQVIEGEVEAEDQDVAIGRLHDPLSLYRRVHKLLRRDSPSVETMQ